MSCPDFANTAGQRWGLLQGLLPSTTLTGSSPSYAASVGDKRPGHETLPELAPGAHARTFKYRGPIRAGEGAGSLLAGEGAGIAGGQFARRSKR